MFQARTIRHPDIPYQLSQHSAYPTNLIGLVMIPKSSLPEPAAGQIPYLTDA